MRLTISFVLLLMIAATGVSYLWRGLGDFDGGGLLRQVSLVIGLAATMISGGLLARIVVKVSVAKRRLGGRQL